MKKLLFFAFACLMSSSLPVAWADDFELIADGRPTASVVIPQNAPSQLKTAVSNFNTALKKVCGSALPVVMEKSNGRNIRFSIRKNNSLLTTDHFEIAFPDQNTLLISGTLESAQWAMNHILRHYAGVEWILPEECGMSYTPMNTIKIPRKKIMVDNISYPVSRVDANWTGWWTQNFRRGLRVDHDLVFHSFPDEKYGRNNSWPKAILPVLNGKKITALPDPERPRHYWQPCYSNPETARIAADNLIEYLDRHPDLFGVSLGTNDNGGYCECSECLKMDKGRSNRSESYYTFVNRVLEMVCTKYPELIVSVLAYSHTYAPPSFKLHKNVLAVMTIDVASCVSPEIMARHKKAIDQWSQKSSMLGIWDYSWGRPYFVPRMYVEAHSEILKYMQKRGGKLYFGENNCCDGFEGPKQYIVYRLLWNASEDPAEIAKEWYERCVGKEAAPYLAAYYKIWNDYFAGPAMKTPWFQSANSVYMTYGDPSHAFGVTPNDIVRADEAMNMVVKLAKTSQEKERAALMMRHWEYSKLLLKIYGVGIYDITGHISTPEQALALLRNAAEYPLNMQKYKEIGEIMIKDRNLNRFYTSKAYISEGYSMIYKKYDTAVANAVLASSAFANDPRVAAELRKTALDPRQPPLIAALCKTFSEAPEKQKNILAGGDAEKEVGKAFEIHPQHRVYANLTVTEKFSSGGRKSFEVKNEGHDALFWVLAPAMPNTTYLAMFKAFIPAPSAEGYLEATLYAEKKGRNQQWRNLPPLKLSGGIWQNFSVMTTTSSSSDSVRLRIYLRKFERGECIYFDDIKIIEVQ